MDTTDDIFEDADELAAQIDHADRLITELMNRVDRLEAELASYWLADAIDEDDAAHDLDPEGLAPSGSFERSE